MAKEKKQELSIEESFDRVEEMLEQLRDEELSLEDSFAIYKNGMELLKGLSGKIDDVEKQVLMLDENGETDEF